LEPIQNLPEHKLVHIRWADSNYIKGWHHPSGEFRPPERIIQTVGWTLGLSDSKCLAIAGSLDEDGSFLNPLFVPWGMIVDYVELPT
jgi:hypothetical protein